MRTLHVFVIIKYKAVSGKNGGGISLLPNDTPSR